MNNNLLWIPANTGNFTIRLNDAHIFLKDWRFHDLSLNKRMSLEELHLKTRPKSKPSSCSLPWICIINTIVGVSYKLSGWPWHFIFMKTKRSWGLLPNMHNLEIFGKKYSRCHMPISSNHIYFSICFSVPKPSRTWAPEPRAACVWRGWWFPPPGTRSRRPAIAALEGSPSLRWFSVGELVKEPVFTKRVTGSGVEVESYFCFFCCWGMGWIYKNSCVLEQYNRYDYVCITHS